MSPEDLVGVEMVKAGQVGTLALGLGVLAGCGEGDEVSSGVVRAEKKLVQAEDHDQGHPISEAEARTADALTIVRQRGWALDDVLEHFDKTEALQDATSAITAHSPHALVGSKVGSPGEPATIWIKGALTAEVKAIVDDAGIPVQVVDSQPYSYTEIAARTHRVAKALDAMGYESYLLGSDITRGGRLDLLIQGDPDTASVVMNELEPLDIEVGIDIIVQQGRVLDDDTTFGGMKVYENADPGNYCTSGFTVRDVSGSTAIGNVTAAHCNDIDKILHPGVGVHSYAEVGGATSYKGFWGDVELHFNASVQETPEFYVYDSVRSVTSLEPEPSSGHSEDEWVCMYSWQQDDAQCVQIVDTGNCANGACNLVKVDEDVAIGGDSGAPWFYQQRAYGIQKASTMGGPDPDGISLYTVAAYFDEAILATVLLDD